MLDNTINGDSMKKYIFVIFSIIILISIFFIFKQDTTTDEKINFIGKNINEVTEYAKKNNIQLEILEEYNDEDEEMVFKQQIIGNKFVVYVSLGNKEDSFKEYKVNELGNIPIMMYHGIENITNNLYTGGNIDKDGYHRTTTAFRKDLEYYYNNGYRMIKLSDYINGNIDVELGKSPIVLTFDDGLENNIKVIGLDENENIIIDSNCAVGILEEFKNRYPDYNVTATFFLNVSLFNQSDYNEKILKWLIDNNYSIGNHSYSHVDFSKIDSNKTQEEIGKMYEVLENLIPGKYDKIVALPFGSPYTINNNNFRYILNGEYNGKSYETISTLRVGWESEYSPFHKNFNKTFLKRIRAYDNNGLDFDIEANFKLLEENKYISDGNTDEVTIPSSEQEKIRTDKKINVY